jgi:RNA polymerase sigma factor (sigma-70 family)
MSGRELFADGKLLTALKCIAAEVKRCGVPDYSIAWDDLVQIGAEAALRRAVDYDPSQGASRMYWARVCARGAMMNAREHCRRRSAVASMSVTDDPQSLQQPDAIETVASVEDLAHLQQQRQKLHAALAKLTAAERQLIALADLRETPIVVISQREGLAANTITTRRKKAIASLREAIDITPL